MTTNKLHRIQSSYSYLVLPSFHVLHPGEEDDTCPGSSSFHEGDRCDIFRVTALCCLRTLEFNVSRKMKHGITLREVLSQ